MDTKDAYIRQLENQISMMQRHIDNLTELILIMRQDKFGASSEKTPKNVADGQMSLFDESEVCADESVPEPVTKEVRGYFRLQQIRKHHKVWLLVISDGSLWKLFRGRRHPEHRLQLQNLAGITEASSFKLKIS